jgi:hypothetical protein
LVMKADLVPDARAANLLYRYPADR